MTTDTANPYAAPDTHVAARSAPDHFDASPVYTVAGRFGRLSYIAWNLVLITIFGLLIVALGLLTGNGVAVANTVVIFALYGGMMYFVVVFSVRRLHDFEQTGWLAILLFVPIANLILPLVLWLVPGTPGANRYGPPRRTTGVERVLGFAGIGVLGLAIAGIVAALTIPLLLA